MNSTEDVDAFLDNKQARERLEEYVSKQQNTETSHSFEPQDSDEKTGAEPSNIVTQKAKVIKPSGYPVDDRFRWQIKDSFHVTRCSALNCHEDAHMNFQFTSGPGKYRDNTNVTFNASSGMIGNPTLTVYVYSKGETIAHEEKNWPDLKGKTYAHYTFHDETPLLGRNVQFGYRLHVPAKDSKGHDRSGTAQYRLRTAPRCTGKTSSGKAFKCLFPAK